MLTPDPREQIIFCVILWKSLLRKLVGKSLNDIKHVQYSNLTLYMMIGVIFNFISTSQASQHLCKVEGVRAVTVNDALFFSGPFYVLKNHFISYFQSGIRLFRSKFSSTLVY